MPEKRVVRGSASRHETSVETRRDLVKQAGHAGLTAEPARGEPQVPSSPSASPAAEAQEVALARDGNCETAPLRQEWIKVAVRERDADSALAARLSTVRASVQTHFFSRVMPKDYRDSARFVRERIGSKWHLDHHMPGGSIDGDDAV